MTEVMVTVFYDVGAVEKRERLRSLESLAKRIDDEAADAKDTLRLLKLARFGDKRTSAGSLRHNDNVVALSGIEADYDGEEHGFDDAVDILEKVGIESIIYTSPSHR